jgi:hypothetical protein
VDWTVEQRTDFVNHIGEWNMGTLSTIVERVFQLLNVQRSLKDVPLPVLPVNVQPICLVSFPVFRNAPNHIKLCNLADTFVSNPLILGVNSANLDANARTKLAGLSKFDVAKWFEVHYRRTTPANAVEIGEIFVYLDHFHEHLITTKLPFESKHVLLG